MGSTILIGKKLLYHSLLNVLIAWFTGVKSRIPSEQDCVTEIKNLLRSKTILCYGAKCKAFMSEMLHANAETECSKYRLHAEVSCLKYRWYDQNTEMLVYIMLKSRDIHIHVAIQNLTVWLSYTKLRITAEQQTISDQLCCISDYFSKISSEVRLEIHCFSIYIVLTSIMA